MGDATCRACPRWSHKEGKPRTELPILTQWHTELVRLAIAVFRDGHLPRAGGMLDQDPKLMAQLWAVRNSPLWRALNLG